MYIDLRKVGGAIAPPVPTPLVNIWEQDAKKNIGCFIIHHNLLKTGVLWENIESGIVFFINFKEFLFYEY